jgi:hypothetical protein
MQKNLAEAVEKGESMELVPDVMDPWGVKARMESVPKEKE